MHTRGGREVSSAIDFLFFIPPPFNRLIFNYLPYARQNNKQKNTNKQSKIK